MQYQLVLVSALAGLASAYYQPDTSKPPQGNAITRPLNEVVPEGKPFQITWKPSTPGKVSILLLQGPAKNVNYLSTIADSIDNTGSFTWNVPADLAPRPDQYAIEIVSEDHTYQYSSQIGISGDGKAVSVSSASAAATTFGSVETAPPSSAAEGTAVCGALDECPQTAAAATSKTVIAAGTGAAATGTANVSSPVVAPTKPMTVPSSLATVAPPSTMTSVVGVAGGASTVAAAGTSKAGPSSAFGNPSAQLSGLAAVAAGLLGLLAL